MARNIFTDFAALSIVAGNMLPLAGVLWFNWSIFELVLTYWAETVIIFFYTHLKILRVKGPAHLLAIPFSAFFWYGFISIHLFLICGLFGPKGLEFAHHSIFGTFWPSNLLDYISAEMATAVFLLFLTHGVDFVVNFIIRKQYRDDTPEDLQKHFVYRIMIMQFTLIIGGWVILLTKTPVWGLAALVIIKIIADLHSYSKRQNLYLD